MATIVDTYEKDGEKINVYESGAHYNATRGHLIKAPERALFTPETSLEAKKRLSEMKRQAIMRGAARALDASGEWETPNQLDVVEAISEAIMQKALNPDNAKQVDAARFILTESGLAESQTKSNESAQQFAGEINDALAEILGRLRGDIIEGSATDIRNELESGESG